MDSLNKRRYGPAIVFSTKMEVWKLDLMWHRYYGPAVPEQDAWWLYDKHIKG